MVYDSCFKKGDLVEILVDMPKIKKDKLYKISHDVSKYHDGICIWINESTKSWAIVDRNCVRKVG